MRYRLLAALSCLSVAGCGDRHADEPAEPEVPAIASGVSPSAPVAPPLYIGVWAVDRALCEIAPGSADPGPIAFTTTEFMGYENRCRIGESQEGTEGGWRLQVFCNGEDGVESKEAIDVDIDGEVLRLIRGGGAQTTFVRCEEKK